MPSQLPQLVLSGAIQELDRKFLELAKRNNLGDGATVVAALILDGSFAIANLGNSRAVLCRVQSAPAGKSKEAEAQSLVPSLLARQLTWEHVPSHAGERARILAAGGKLMPRSPRAGGRLRLQGELEVSRSLGDAEYRRYGLIAEPDVSGFQAIHEDDLFLVLASDGLFETLEPQEVCDHAWAVATGSATPPATPPPPPPIPLGPVNGTGPPDRPRVTTGDAEGAAADAAIAITPGLQGCCDCFNRASQPGVCRQPGAEQPHTLEQAVANRLVEEAYNQRSTDNIAVAVVNLWRHLREVSPQGTHGGGDTTPGATTRSFAELLMGRPAAAPLPTLSEACAPQEATQHRDVNTSSVLVPEVAAAQLPAAYIRQCSLVRSGGELVADTTALQGLADAEGGALLLGTGAGGPAFERCPAVFGDEEDDAVGQQGCTAAPLPANALVQCGDDGPEYRLLERLSTVPTPPSHRHMHHGRAGTPLELTALRGGQEQEGEGERVQLRALNLDAECSMEGPILSTDDEPDSDDASELYRLNPTNPPFLPATSHPPTPNPTAPTNPTSPANPTAPARAPALQPAGQALPQPPHHHHTVAPSAPAPNQHNNHSHPPTHATNSLLDAQDTPVPPPQGTRSSKQLPTTAVTSASPIPSALTSPPPSHAASPPPAPSTSAANSPSSALLREAATPGAKQPITTPPPQAVSACAPGAAATLGSPPCSLLLALAEPPLPNLTERRGPRPPQDTEPEPPELPMDRLQMPSIQPQEPGSMAGGPGRRLSALPGMVSAPLERSGRGLMSENPWTLQKRFAGGHFGEVWRASRQLPAERTGGDHEGAPPSGTPGAPPQELFVLKRILAERGAPVRLSGLREAYFGERVEGLRSGVLPDTSRHQHQNSTPSLQDGQDHLVRFVESFETRPGGDLWLVFHDEGESLHGLMYEGLDGGGGESSVLPEGQAAGEAPEEPPSGADSPGDGFVMMGPSTWWHRMRHSSGGHDVMRDLLRQLLLALHVLHSANISHRDVKPENLLIRGARRAASNASMHMRLIDFGSALDPYALQQLYGDAGPSDEELTLEYAPPEVLFGRYWQGMTAMKHVWTYDIWSVGVVWLELILGTPHVFQLNSHTQAVLDHKLRLHEKSEGERQLVYLLRGMMELCIYPPQVPASKRGRKDGAGLLTWSCNDDALLALIRSRDPSGEGLPGRMALRLLMRLLHWDPASRPTALQALQHAYFTQPTQDNGSTITCPPPPQSGWC